MFSFFSTVFLFYCLVTFLGITVLPLGGLLFRRFPDSGWGFSKTIGWGLLSWLAWVLGSFKILPFSSLGCWAILFGSVVLVWGLLGKHWWGGIRNKKKFWRTVAVQEVMFFILFVLLCWVRAYYPGIANVEKPMDLAFVNSILRSRSFPPVDPWLAGKHINYYYFGHLMTAVLSKLILAASSVVFNLTSVLLIILAGQGLFSLGHFLSGRLGGGWLTAFFGVLAGNLHYVLRGWYDVDPNTQHYFYPRATRIVPFTINEFPAYSLVLGDLHAHVLSLPIFVLGVGLVTSWFVADLNSNSNRKYPILPFFIGWVSGCAFMTSSWDALTLGVLFGFLLVVKAILFRKVWPWRIILTSGVTALVGAVISCGLYVFNFKPPVSGIGLVHTRSPVDFYFVFFGGQFLLLAIGMLVFLYYQTRQVLISKFVWFLTFFTLVLMLVPEFFYLKDIFSISNPSYYRTNTIFKIHFQVWVLLSLIGVALFSRAYREVRSRLLKMIMLLVLGSLVFGQGVYTISAFSDASGNYGNWWGLDGADVLAQSFPGDYRAIRWLQGNVKEQSVILEAVGPSYTRYARVSSWTGLPTVIGWVNHEWQWRGEWGPYHEKELLVKRIYEGADRERVLSALKEAGVSYIYIGELEREQYKSINIELLESLGQVVYSSPDTIIIRLS